MALGRLLFLVAAVTVLYTVVGHGTNKWTDPSLNTEENNARVIEEVRQGLHKHHGHEHDHGHHHHDHGHHHHDHGHHDHDHGHHHHDHGHHHHDHGHHHHDHGHHHHDHGHEEPSEPQENVWLKAFGATILISLAPFLVLYLIPIDRRNEAQENFLKVLLAFASGGLLGDAFLHLIPHAISPHSHGDHDHGHDHHGHDHHGHSHGAEMSVGMYTLGGILTFLLIEKFVIAVKGGHSHSHGPAASGDAPKADDKTKKDKNSEDESEEKEEEEEKKEEDICEPHAEAHQEVKVSAYLNMAADMTHNFTDGLAIGSSFLVSDKMGYITTFLILVHEIPHEIGDFAILVQSGFTKRNAMNFQLVTAMGALMGTACGLLAESFFASASQFILPFTAGGFIYIATVTVLPELLEGASSLWQGFKEISALCIGIGLMVLIAEYE